LFSSSLLGAAYTVSKFIDDTDGTIFFNEQGVSSPTRMNYYNLKADRSLDAFDAPHRLVFSYTVELPLERQRRARAAYFRLEGDRPSEAAKRHSEHVRSNQPSQ